MDLAALKTEIATAPYAGKDDEQCAKLLNTPSKLIDRETIDAGTIVGAMVRAEYDALSTAGKDYLEKVIQAGNLPITPTLRTNLATLFGPATTTRANLLVALRRTGSRSEELGLGRVTESDVADARRFP